MNIALIGYGKMGQAIAQIAQERGHHIALIISSANKADLNAEQLKAIDVAIEFTVPTAAFQHVKACIEAHTPVVSGTTGWQALLPEAQQLATQHKVGFLHATNFSMGVNILFELNQQLARIMQRYPSYTPSISETHHIHKKDAPSGTAITLAEGILGQYSQIKEWTLDNASPEQLHITAERTDNVPGTHYITYHSEVDDLVIGHIAHNRTGFALGAVLAAEYIQDKQGSHTMKDVLFGS